MKTLLIALTVLLCCIAYFVGSNGVADHNCVHEYRKGVIACASNAQCEDIESDLLKCVEKK